MKFVMLTDTKTSSLRVVLHQIWVNLYVEYVVRNPLSPVEHPGGLGVNNELFEMGLDRFIVWLPYLAICESFRLTCPTCRPKSSTHHCDLVHNSHVFGGPRVRSVYRNLGSGLYSCRTEDRSSN